MTAAELRQRFAASADSPSAACERRLAAAHAADLGQPPLRACICLLEADARAAAAAADQRWRAGTPLSLLDGIPLVIKDSIDVQGHPTTMGTRPDGQPPATSEGGAVARLRAAGAVILAKANLHELAGGLTGFNPHHGTARNPYDPARICGGSSSGSAAAVAAGLVPLALGTDAGGSVRCPAALTGLLGLKPSFGRIARTGLPLFCATLDHIGLLGHDSADVAALLATLAPGPDDDDPDTAEAPVLDSAEAAAAVTRALGDGDGLRIGFDRTLWSGLLVEPALVGALEASLELLARHGARLHEVRLPDPERTLLIGSTILAAEGALVLAELPPDAHPRMGAAFQRLMADTAGRLARDYLAALEHRIEVQRSYLTLLSPDAADGCDLLALPASGCVAPLLLECGALDPVTARRLQSHFMPASVTGLPALSVPCGAVDGLPIALQLVGRPWGELTLLRVAAALERAGGSPRVRPQRWFG